jgi:hypothetical protein
MVWLKKIFIIKLNEYLIDINQQKKTCLHSTKSEILFG